MASYQCKTFARMYYFRFFNVLHCKFVKSKSHLVLQCKACKILTYEVFKFFHSNIINMNMLNTTIDDGDVDIVDIDNGVSSIL